MERKKANKSEEHRSTISGLALDAVYRALPRRKGGAGAAELPGEFPYTRGIHRSMYRGKLWTMRQYAGFGSATETNRRYRYLLARGSTGLSVAFDLPTQMGRDSDHALAKGEVGRVGVAVSSVEDMRALFANIALDQVSVSMTINATAAIVLAFYLIAAEELGTSWGKLSGTVQNDILKEYIARGTYIYPPQSGMRLVTDLISFCGDEVPLWNTVSISGYHIREAGSTAVDEIAFTLANGIAYVEAAVARGLRVDDFAPRLAFFFNCHIDFFEEVAKFRAARRLWAAIMRTRFKAKDPRSMMLRFHTQTAGSSLTAQQPINNVVRTTVEALAAVLGGTQSLHTNGYDEALGLPSAESATVALRTQQILAYESGVASVADPLGGSYFIEDLTARLEREASAKISQIDSSGGMVRAIEAGVPQRDIERSAYEFQRRVESGERVIVGINSFAEDFPSELQPLIPDAKLERAHVARLKALRRRRDSKRVEGALRTIAAVARSENNLMPSILEAARHRATLGEISDCLRTVFGEYESVR